MTGTDLSNLPNPWEQLPDEGGAEYQAFTEFCKLGPTRSLRRVQSRIGISYDLTRQWGKKYNWNQRAQALDAETLKIKPQDIKMEVHDTLQFQYAVGTIMLQMGFSAVQLANPKNVKMKDAIRLIEKGAELQREGLGINNSNPGITINVAPESVTAVNDLIGMIEGNAIEDSISEQWPEEESRDDLD